MNWIKQIVILFVFESGLLVSSARARFKLQPAERFEFCVSRNLSGLSVFHEEDKERINKIVMETSVRMHELKENEADAKTMLRLFAVALACAVADCDSSARPQRERACLTAIEACAKSLKAPEGIEVVKEMKKIFLAMNREISTLDAKYDHSAANESKKKERLEKNTKEYSEDEIREEEKESPENSTTTEMREKDLEEYSKVKERFKRANIPPFRFSSFSTVGPTLETIIADKLLKSSTFQKYFTVGMAQEDADFYSRAMVENGLGSYRYDIVQEAKNAVTTALSRLGPFAGSYDYAHAIARSLAVVLAAHELTFYADGLGIGSSLIYQLDSMLGSDTSSASAPGAVSSSEWGSSSAFSSSQASASVQVNPSYSDSSLAIPSNSQNNRWNPSYVDSSFAFPSNTQNSRRNPIYVDSSLATPLNTQSIRRNPSYVDSSFSIPLNSQNDRSPSYVDSTFAAPSNTQNNRRNPSYVEPSFAFSSNPQNDKTQFQNRLSYFLSQSLTISETFCSGPFPRLFEIINSAFADYGYSISSTIANVVSNSLNMLPTEAACTQYAEVISEVVANILDSNGFIPTGDPQAITNKVSDLISSNIQANPSSFGQEGSDYPLNPSFSDYSYSAPEVPDYPATNPGSPISSSVSDITFQHQNPVLTNSTEFFDDSAPSVILSTNKQEFHLPTGPSFDRMDSFVRSSLSSDGSVAENSKQDGHFPTELSSDGLDASYESPLSSDGSVAENNSWVIVEHPSSSAVIQKDQTSDLAGIKSPIMLEPGPVLLENIPTYSEKAPETKVPDTDTTPPTIEATKAAEMTTPVPLNTNLPFSTVIVTSEVITPAPQTDLMDAFQSPSQLSEFLMKQMTSTLKVSNTTLGDEKNQAGGDSSTNGKNPKSGDSSSASEDSPDTEVKASVETPPQQTDEVRLNPPPPITDEVSALLFGEKVSSIVSAAIDLIRSQNFKLDQLCDRLNHLAPMLNLPPLDVYSEIPLIDYLLHVVNAVTYSLAGEK